MKKLRLLPLFIGLIFFSSCAFHSGLVNNFNNNTTTVELSKNNFKIVDYVKGSAHCTYVFGIGGLSKDALVEKAKSEMYRKADLQGKAKTIANISIDTKYSSFPIVKRVTVTASGHVVQFE